LHNNSRAHNCCDGQVRRLPHQKSCCQNISVGNLGHDSQRLVFFSPKAHEIVTKYENRGGKFGQCPSSFSECAQSDSMRYLRRLQRSEELQGKSLIDDSLKQNVQFFVYSSVDRGGDASYTTPTKVPHFINKHNIEHHLVEKSKSADMKWFILRPAAFYENLAPDFFGKVFATSFKMAPKGKPLQMVATDDIGFFGAEAFAHPEAYQNKSLSLAGMS
ncbi:hypothetical protein N7533_009397, partial [Penicillium manginii]|uniref:uncharacterized protein n=1 Tax=Penicillium manginii TaxID=203109 RepID=UPI0025493577